MNLGNSIHPSAKGDRIGSPSPEQEGWTGGEWTVMPEEGNSTARLGRVAYLGHQAWWPHTSPYFWAQPDGPTTRPHHFPSSHPSRPPGPWGGWPLWALCPCSLAIPLGLLLVTCPSFLDPPCPNRGSSSASPGRGKTHVLPRRQPEASKEYETSHQSRRAGPEVVMKTQGNADTTPASMHQGAGGGDQPFRAPSELKFYTFNTGVGRGGLTKEFLNPCCSLQRVLFNKR